MADWTDGPEYAPHERPDAFVASGGGTAILAAPSAPVDAAQPPTMRPDFTAPDAGPLDRPHSPSADERDPREAFDVPAAVITAPRLGPEQPPATEPLTLSTQPTPAPAYEAAPGTTTGTLPQARWEPPSQLPPSTPATQASAWGSAHSAQAAPRPHDPWAPQQPLALPNLPAVNLPPGASGPAAHVNPQAFPTQDAAQWYATYGSPIPPGPQLGPVTAKALLTASDPATLGCLAVGGLLPFAGLGWTAPPLLIVAMVLASQRIRYRPTTVRHTFWWVLGASAILAVLAVLESYAPALTAWWESFCGWAQFGCRLLIPILLLIVGGALRRGEQPQA